MGPLITRRGWPQVDFTGMRRFSIGKQCVTYTANSLVGRSETQKLIALAHIAFRMLTYSSCPWRK